MKKLGNTSLTILKPVPITQIKLDLENPRYYEALVASGDSKWTEKKLEEHILAEDDIADIFGSIKLKGVIDPVWIYEVKSGSYVMVEGSRRLVSLRRLSKEKPPKGVSYTEVLAHVYPKSTDQKILNVQKVILQTGKKKWGAFNEAKAIHDLIKQDMYSIDEVSKNLQKSRGTIEKELENFKIYHELTKYIKAKKLGIQNPRYYSYFQKASAYNRDRFFTTKKGREQFFNLILPVRGEAKIKSVALKGGLIKAFNKFSVNENILKKFMKNPTYSADAALLDFKGGSLYDEYPWLKRLKEVSTGMGKLSKDEVKKIKKDKTIANNIARIHLNSKDFINK